MLEPREAWMYLPTFYLSNIPQMTSPFFVKGSQSTRSQTKDATPPSGSPCIPSSQNSVLASNPASLVIRNWQLNTVHVWRVAKECIPRFDNSIIFTNSSLENLNRYQTTKLLLALIKNYMCTQVSNEVYFRVKCLEGRRSVPMDGSFWVGYRRNIVKPDEILLAVNIPFTTQVSFEHSILFLLNMCCKNFIFTK